jgi:hypothetical protein
MASAIVNATPGALAILLIISLLRGPRWGWWGRRW